MKIVYYSTSDLSSRSANSIHVMKMCQAFAKLGHDVILFAPSENVFSLEGIYDKYGVKNNFRIELIKKSKRRFWQIRYSIEGSIILRKIAPDIVYGRAFLGCILSSFKYLTSWESHAKINHLIKSILLKYVMIFNKKFRGIVVISENLRKEYLRYYKSSKIFTAHDGADLFSENERIYISNKNINIGYIGHLYNGKGMEVISELIKSTDYTYHIVGGAEKDINFWKSQLASYANVIFYGYVPHKDTQKYINSFDILVAPYQEKVSVYGGKGDVAEWMSPLKIFEYMSSGKPIISSELKVLKEVLVNKQNSLLCNPNNIDEWIDSIDLLVNDKELSNHISRNAIQDFTQNYTWDQRSSNILSFVRGEDE